MICVLTPADVVNVTVRFDAPDSAAELCKRTIQIRVVLMAASTGWGVNTGLDHVPLPGSDALENVVVSSVRLAIKQMIVAPDGTSSDSSNVFEALAVLVSIVAAFAAEKVIVAQLDWAPHSTRSTARRIVIIAGTLLDRWH
jgi:hypothetical protein